MSSLSMTGENFANLDPEQLFYAAFTAAHFGQFDALKAALEKGADTHAVNSGGQTLLLIAASRGRADCVQILAPISDAKMANKDGKTALMCAAAAGDPQSVETLLPLSDPEAKDRAGRTALAQAIQAGSVECVRRLAPKSAHATQRSGSVNYLALAALKAQAGYSANSKPSAEECAEMILLIGAFSDPGLRDDNGRTALMRIMEHDKPHVKAVAALASISKLISAHGAEKPLRASG